MTVSQGVTTGRGGRLKEARQPEHGLETELERTPPLRPAEPSVATTGQVNVMTPGKTGLSRGCLERGGTAERRDGVRPLAVTENDMCRWDILRFLTVWIEDLLE